MPQHSSVGVSNEQKQALIRFKALLEGEAGKEVSQGEALRIAADVASERPSEGAELL